MAEGVAETLKEKKGSILIAMLVVFILIGMIVGGSWLAKGGDPQGILNKFSGGVGSIFGGTTDGVGDGITSIIGWIKEKMKSILINTIVIFAVLFVLLQLNKKTEDLFIFKKGSNLKPIIMYIILIFISIFLGIQFGESAFAATKLAWLFKIKVLANLAIIIALLYLLATFTILKESKENKQQAKTAIYILIVIISIVIASKVNNPGGVANENFIWEQTTGFGSNIANYLWAGSGDDHSYMAILKEAKGDQPIIQEKRYSILKGTHIIVFIGATLLLIWIFQIYAKDFSESSYKIHYILSALLGAQMANTGTELSTFIRIAYVAFLLIIYGQFKKNIQSEIWAGTLAFAITEVMASVVYPDASIASIFGERLGVFQSLGVGLIATLLISAIKIGGKTALNIRQEILAEDLKKGKGWFFSRLAGTKKGKKGREESEKKLKELEAAEAQREDLERRRNYIKQSIIEKYEDRIASLHMERTEIYNVMSQQRTNENMKTYESQLEKNRNDLEILFNNRGKELCGEAGQKSKLEEIDEELDKVIEEKIKIRKRK